MATDITVTSNPDPAQLETCLLLEGDVTVTPDGGEPVRKHYRFG
jgi:uncharacterized cupin superfamily protein